MKKCTKCGQKKSANEFYKDSRTKDGLYSSCRRCHVLLKSYSEKDREYMRKYSKRTPEIMAKQKARQDLCNAVARGLVKKKSCEVCSNKKTHGHHPDYSKPLEVIWLCVTHHA